jgi:hypothetical protein
MVLKQFEFGGCKLAHFHCIINPLKDAKKLGQFAAFKLKLFQNHTYSKRKSWKGNSKKDFHSTTLPLNGR